VHTYSRFLNKLMLKDSDKAGADGGGGDARGARPVLFATNLKLTMALLKLEKSIEIDTARILTKDEDPSCRDPNL
jgi:hypothetical protein